MEQFVDKPPDKPKNTDTVADRQWINVFILVTGFLVLFIVGLLGFMALQIRERDDWQVAMQRHLADEGRAFDAMRPVLEAMERTDWSALRRHREALQAAARQPWVEDPKVADILRRHQGVIALIARSAALPEDSFPSLLDYEIDRPLPRFERLQLLTLLLKANARRLQSEGAEAEAAQRLVEIAVLGTRFSRPLTEASFSSHGVAITIIDQAAGALGELVRDASTLTPQTLARLDQQLAEIETRYRPIRSAAYDELDLYSHLITRRARTPEELAVLLQFYDPDLRRSEANTLAAERFVEVSALPAELARLRALVDAELAAPHHARNGITAEGLANLTTLQLARVPLKNLGALSAREGMMLARLRMVRTLCRLQIGHTSEEPLIDPFTGEPFVIRGGAIISAGPDRRLEDSGHSPMNLATPLGPGDLVLQIGARHRARGKE